MPNDNKTTVNDAASTHRIGPETPETRLRGSAPTHPGRRGPETAADAELRPRDLPPVSAPDIAFQFKPCLPGSLENDVKDAVVSSVTGVADVRIICAGGSSRLGIWMRPPGGADDGPARDAALRSFELLKQGENYAAFINASLIKSRAQDAFEAKFAGRPKRLDGNGNLDADGPVHLSRIRVDFNAPNRVITTIDGFDERPWPDVDFHMITTDTLSASAGGLQVAPKHSLDTDTGWLVTLTAIMGVLTTLVSGWFGIGYLLFFTEGILVAGAGAPDTGEGAGGAVHSLPKEIMVPGKLKVVEHYERVEVSNGGIFTGGFIVVDVRTPSLRILGETRLALKEGLTRVRRSYSVITEDLRAPLTFHWTAEGIASTPGAQSTGINFQMPSNPPPKVGDVISKDVRIHVADADGLVQDAQTVLEIHIVSADPDDNKPPVCRVKPWLPQCQV